MSEPLLEKKLADAPIKLPKSPFLEVCQRFGLDEALAMFINVIGTGIISLFSASPILLSFAGPVIEKIGFFPLHFKQAYDLYRTTPEKRRHKLSKYFARALKSSSKSLIQDILIHDPIYIILMFTGLKLYPLTPPWLLALGSFLIAVVIVALLEVGYTEISYKLFKKRLKTKGFGIEFYYESRFYIDTNVDPKLIINELAKEFNLNTIKLLKYNDKYYENKLNTFNGRTATLRLRHRELNKGKEIKTAQIIYTRSSEIAKKELMQYKYFPQRKEKIYFFLKQKMPKDIDKIKDKNIKKIMKKFAETKNTWQVKFNRYVAYDPETLLISMDHVIYADNKPDFYVLEIKTYKDIRLLKKAMRYIMKHFPVIQTTHGKLDLVILQE